LGFVLLELGFKILEILKLVFEHKKTISRMVLKFLELRF